MWCNVMYVYHCISMYVYIYIMYIIHVYTLWGWRAPLLTATWVFTRGPRFDLTHGFPRPCWPCPYWSLYASCDAHAHDQRRLDRWANDVRREGLWLILIEYYLDILIAFLKVFLFCFHFNFCHLPRLIGGKRGLLGWNSLRCDRWTWKSKITKHPQLFACKFDELRPSWSPCLIVDLHISEHIYHIFLDWPWSSLTGWYLVLIPEYNWMTKNGELWWANRLLFIYT